MIIYTCKAKNVRIRRMYKPGLLPLFVESPFSTGCHFLWTLSVFSFRSQASITWGYDYNDRLFKMHLKFSSYDKEDNYIKIWVPSFSTLALQYLLYWLQNLHKATFTKLQYRKTERKRSQTTVKILTRQVSAFPLSSSVHDIFKSSAPQTCASRDSCFIFRDAVNQ